MAQQTINVGAAPNDGTGTPLRTAFQYTNSNFTELYTAVGPSGNNIVVPGNATISGDLTVDTSTLKVDSANDRVGFGTASPAQFVHLSKSNTSTALTAPPVGGASLRIQNSSSTNNNFGSVEFYNAAGLFGASVNCQYTNQATPTNDLVFVTRGSSGGLEHYRIAADGVCTWSDVGGVAGTAMTLNSTGLGVGGSPSYKLDVAGAANSAPITLLRLNNTGTTGGGPGIAARLQFNAGATALGFVQGCNFASGSIGVQISGDGTNIHQTIDSSGNVGIGVTPSAWPAGFKAIQIGATSGQAAALFNNGLDNTWLVSNAFFSGGNWNKFASGTATLYEQGSGAHKWYNNTTVASGTFTPTQAMTLDASGNLLVGTTSGTFRGTFVVAGGANRDILAAGVTAVSDGFQVKWNHATTKINVIISNMPTSSAGLAAGTLWNDAGTIKIA